MEKKSFSYLKVFGWLGFNGVKSNFEHAAPNYLKDIKLVILKRIVLLILVEW